MNKLNVFPLLVCAGLAGIFLWLSVDEPLEESTRHWLEDERASPREESLDFLYLVGLAAPPGEDPVEHGRVILSQAEADPLLKFDLTTELLGDLPCEPEDLACWQMAGTWPDGVLRTNRHILERWQSYPVHEDFFIPATGPTFTVLTPVIQLADSLISLDLVDHWRHGELDQAVDTLGRQVERLARVPHKTEDLLSVLMIYALVGSRMNELMLAILWGAAPVDEFHENNLHEPIDVKSVLSGWARRELQVIDGLPPHFGWPLGLASQRNRTLNRGRRCLEEVVRLADRKAFLEALQSGFGDCGGQPLRLRNWKGDQIVNWLLMVDATPACHAHLSNIRLELATALLEARTKFDNPEARLAHVAAGNPFGLEAGVLVRDEKICYAKLNTSACSNICLTSPFNLEATADSDETPKTQ